MSAALESELRSMLVFYGENPDGQDATKPEDLFGLILSFSSSLPVCFMQGEGANELKLCYRKQLLKCMILRQRI